MPKPSQDNVTEANEALATALEASQPDPSPEFHIMGRIAVNKGGAEQNGYNLLVLDNDATQMLDRFADMIAEYQGPNEQGDYWAAITVNPGGKALIRQATKTGATKLVVEGKFTFVDVVNGKLEGNLIVTAARPANILDGGRIVTRERRERDAAPAAVVPQLGLRNRG